MGLALTLASEGWGDGMFEPWRLESEGNLSVRQRAEFRDFDSNTPTDPSASLQRLLASMGAGTREALWAVQLIERKAAVARWRSGQCGKGQGRSPQCGKGRRT